jgi:hypothetical protein
MFATMKTQKLQSMWLGLFMTPCRTEKVDLSQKNTIKNRITKKTTRQEESPEKSRKKQEKKQKT